MILVDSSVWIDLFRGIDSPESKRLVAAISEDADLCICGLILTEVLQGTPDERQYRHVKQAFSALIYLPMAKEEYVLAADLYRNLRSRGKTIRNTVECLIAACAIAHNVVLLHKDKDFHALASMSNLKFLEVKKDGRRIDE